MKQRRTSKFVITCKSPPSQSHSHNHYIWSVCSMMVDLFCVLHLLQHQWQFDLFLPSFHWHHFLSSVQRHHIHACYVHDIASCLQNKRKFQYPYLYKLETTILNNGNGRLKRYNNKIEMLTKRQYWNTSSARLKLD